MEKSIRSPNNEEKKKDLFCKRGLTLSRFLFGIGQICG